MAARHKIRWRDADEERLRKDVKNFNQKVDRLAKAHPELAGSLPEKVRKKDLQSRIATRADLERELKSLERFGKRGSEKIVRSASGNMATLWEKKEYGYKVAAINRIRARERKAAAALEATSRGKPLGYTRGEMLSDRLSELEPKKYNFDNIKGGREWEMFKATVDRQIVSSYRDERKEQFRENYIKGLRNILGDAAEDIISLIMEVPIDTFITTYYAEQEASIDFIYDPVDQEMKTGIIEDIWTAALL